MPIITVNDISKEFKSVKRESGLKGAIKGLFSTEYITKKAIEKVNFKIEKGEFIGLIGPNGAGKSTIIKILTGILTPTNGKVIVNGIEPYVKRKENAKNIGVVFGQRSQLWWDLPVKDSFDLLKAIYKIDDNDYNKRLNEFKKILGIQKYIHQPVRKLSLGERMRCDLVASLIHNPDIVYLDEPTIGLDVESKHRIRAFLKKKNKEGTTIILTTHDMGDVEELCPRLIIIDKGKLIFDGPTDDIRNKMSNQRTITVNYFKKAPEIKAGGMKVKTKRYDKVAYQIDTNKISTSAFIKKILKYKIDDMIIHEPSIEEIIRRIYRKGM